MTNGSLLPREFWIYQKNNETWIAEERLPFNKIWSSETHVIQYSAFHAANEQAEAAIKRAEAAEKERDELVRLLGGEEVELKCKNPGYHATVKFDVAQNPSESESAGVREK